MQIEFHVRGEPKAQPRVKAFRRGNHAGVYDPGTADGWKLLVREEARKAWDGKQFDGPVSVHIEFWMPRPKAHFNKNGIKDDAPNYHTSKPDLDNLLKAVFDAITNLGIWRDDSQIVRVNSSKQFCKHPCAYVCIQSTQ